MFFFRRLDRVHLCYSQLPLLEIHCHPCTRIRAVRTCMYLWIHVPGCTCFLSHEITSSLGSLEIRTQNTDKPKGDGRNREYVVEGGDSHCRTVITCNTMTKLRYMYSTCISQGTRLHMHLLCMQITLISVRGYSFENHSLTNRETLIGAVSTSRKLLIWEKN